MQRIDRQLGAWCGGPRAMGGAGCRGWARWAAETIAGGDAGAGPRGGRRRLVRAAEAGEGRWARWVAGMGGAEKPAAGEIGGGDWCGRRGRVRAGGRDGRRRRVGPVGEIGRGRRVWGPGMRPAPTPTPPEFSSASIRWTSAAPASPSVPDGRQVLPRVPQYPLDVSCSRESLSTRWTPGTPASPSGSRADHGRTSCPAPQRSTRHRHRAPRAAGPASSCCPDPPRQTPQC